MISLIAFEVPEMGYAYINSDKIYGLFTDYEGRFRLSDGSANDYLVVPQTFRLAFKPQSLVDTIQGKDLDDLIVALNKILPSVVDCVD
jgi:hypothetical protein